MALDATKNGGLALKFNKKWQLNIMINLINLKNKELI